MKAVFFTTEDTEKTWNLGEGTFSIKAIKVLTPLDYAPFDKLKASGAGFRITTYFHPHLDPPPSRGRKG
jgi:hypothetical protein